MTVARDAVLAFAPFTTTTPATLSFTPVGTPRGITVHIAVRAGGDLVTGVTYGGVAMARVASSTDVSSETGFVCTYFLGVGIPTGTQPVSIAHTGESPTKWAVVQSVTAAADTEIGTLGLVIADIANPTTPLDTGSIEALRVGIIFSGHDDLTSLAPLTGMEAIAAGNSHDFAAQVAALAEQTTASTGLFNLGYTATIEDVAMASVSIQEIVADGFPHTVAPTVTRFTTTATTHLVVMPSVVNAGELLLMVYSGPSRAVTTPTNWTLLSNAVNSVELNIFYKIADGSEDGTTVDVATGTNSIGQAAVFRYTNWHGTTPPEAGTAVLATTTTPNPPSLTPSWGAADTAWLAVVAVSGNAPATAYPTSYDNGGTIYSAGTENTTISTARRSLNTATEDPGTFTGANGATVAQTIAIRSVAASTSGTVAVTQADQTSTATGTVLNPVTGTVAVTQAAQTSTASGVVATPVTGTVAQFQANQTSTATGSVSVGITGTLAVTQASQTSTASGTTGAEGVTGSAAVTQNTQMSASGGASWSVAGGIPGQAVDGGLRFEAFQLPDIGFERKFDLTRWVAQSNITDKWDQQSDGELLLKSDFPRLTDLLTVDPADHSNDVGSIVRVLRGQTPVLHYMLKQRDDTWSSDNGTIKCHLEGMEYFMDKATVPRYDYPANPSLDPDHIYGAKSILRTIGGESTNEIVDIWTDATSGAGSLTFDGETTGPLAFNATSGDVKTLLEDLSPALGYTLQVDVSGTGDPLTPWTIAVVQPAGDIGTITRNVGTLNAALNGSVITTGGTLSPRPWHESFNPVTQLTHGTYDLFEIVSTPVPAGDTYALAIDGGDPVFASDYSGCQLIVEVTPGRTYRASIPVRANSGTEVFRFVIRDMSENLIAATPDTQIGTTYTTMSIPTLKIPAGVTQIIYRVGIIDAGNPGKVFVGIESALLAPGQEAAPFGKIMWDLFDLVQAAGRLTWLVPTFTDTHDSDGVPWDRNLEWAVKRRQSLWQLCEYAKRWFYLNRVRWNDSAGVFNWDAFNPNGGGTDYTGTGLAISGRTGVTSSGVISHRAPDATYYDAEGDGGQWGEFEDVTLTGAWGPLDKYYPNRQGLDSAGLDILAERLVDDAATRTEGIVIRLEAPTALPWDRFRPGDLVMINLGPKQPKQVMRCMAVVASQGGDDSHPAYDTHWGSVVYQGEAATAHMLRTLWRKFETLDMFDGPATIDPAGGGCCPSCAAHVEGVVQLSDNDPPSGLVAWTINKDPAHILTVVGGQIEFAIPGLISVQLGGTFRYNLTAGGWSKWRFSSVVYGNDAPGSRRTIVDQASASGSEDISLDMFHWANVENSGQGYDFFWTIVDSSGTVSTVTTPIFEELEVMFILHAPGCANERFCT